ncbi:MAG: MarR family transcriptional regulator, partial [Sphaerochaetaceae bacterium]
MKLSQPRSARSINTCRVLNLIRSEKGLSKAELSRKMGLNKVSVGEIVDKLVSQGIVKEAGKLESSNGRRPMSLELSKDSRFALGVDIGPKTSMIALS